MSTLLSGENNDQYLDSNNVDIGCKKQLERERERGGVRRRDARGERESERAVGGKRIEGVADRARMGERDEDARGRDEDARGGEEDARRRNEDARGRDEDARGRTKSASFGSSVFSQQGDGCIQVV